MYSSDTSECKMKGQNSDLGLASGMYLLDLESSHPMTCDTVPPLHPFWTENISAEVAHHALGPHKYKDRKKKVNDRQERLVVDGKRKRQIVDLKFHYDVGG